MEHLCYTNLCALKAYLDLNMSKSSLCVVKVSHPLSLSNFATCRIGYFYIYNIYIYTCMLDSYELKKQISSKITMLTLKALN